MMAAANQPLMFGKEVVTGKCGLDNNGNRNVEHEPIYVIFDLLVGVGLWKVCEARFLKLFPEFLFSSFFCNYFLIFSKTDSKVS